MTSETKERATAGPIADETELIQTYLEPLARAMPGAFGLADDAALIATMPGVDLVVTSDPIIAGVHFFPGGRPDDIAWKALAVNVSDLVAKGAAPLAYILTLAFPEMPDRAWMTTFVEGLAAAQATFGCALVGGDTDRTPGPLAIGITAFGAVPKGKFVPRRGARTGDHVYVSGTLGDSALGLLLHRESTLYESTLTDGDRSFLVGRYLRPSPRLALAGALRTHASAALDISDGFLKDLGRLTGLCGLRTPFTALPLSPSLRAALAVDSRVADVVLTGGDDYEVLLTVPEDGRAAFESDARACGVAVTHLGALVAHAENEITDTSGRPILPQRAGYDHFAR